MTLTLAAVYAPVAFTPGRTGRLFIEFALTLAGAVLVSGFVALTLTPMMCSKLLQAQAEAGPAVSPLIERGFTALRTRLSPAAQGVAARAVAGAAVALGWSPALGVVFFFAAQVGAGADRGPRRAFRSRGTGAGRRDARRSPTAMRAGRAHPARADPGGRSPIWSSSACRRSPQFIAIGRLKDWDERDRKQQEHDRASSAPKLRQIAGVSAFATIRRRFGQRGGGAADRVRHPDLRHL